MRRQYLAVTLALSVFALLSCRDETLPTSQSVPLTAAGDPNNPAEGELFGRLYSNGVALTTGSGFAVSLDPVFPVDLLTTRLRGGFSDEQSAAITSGKAHYGWNDPVANDGACQGIPDWNYGNRASSVAGYENGARWDSVANAPQYWAIEAHPRGAPSDPSVLEMHCIRPGTYQITGTYPGMGLSRRIDYVGIEAGPGSYVEVPLTNLPGQTAQIEAASYSTDDYYRDVEANFDIVAQPGKASVAPTLDVDAASSYSTGTFTPNQGTSVAAPGDYVRALTTVVDDPSYLARLWWEYGTTPNVAGGFYSTHVQGYLLRWHQIPIGFPAGCLVVGADVVHMSLAPGAVPQVFQRVGVGRECGTGPDLVIGSVASGYNGATVAPQLKISNVAQLSASGTVSVQLYASTDQSCCTGDVSLGSQNVSLGTGLAPNATQTSTLSPATVPATGAQYYLFAVLSGVTGEGETSNNTMWDPVPFTAPVPPMPDFTPTSVTGPGTYIQGGSGTVPVVVSNAGAGAAAPNAVKVYLSTNSTWEAGDVQIGTLTDLASLGSGSNRTENVQVTIPTSQAIASYFILAKVDANGAVAESNESNNVGARSGQVTVTGAPDIRVTSINGPATIPVNPTGAISYDVHYRNFGSAATGSATWYLALAWSTDTIFGPGDVTVSSGSVSTSLSPYGQLGDSGLRTLWVVPPAGTTAGNYYLVAKVDTTNVIAESNEANNTLAKPVSATAGGGDLSATPPNPMVTSAAPSEYADTIVRFRVLNNGTAAIPAGWQGEVWASTDKTLGAGDVLVTSWTQESPIAAGGSQTFYLPGTAPSSPGVYWFIVRLDSANNIPETNESNNVTVSSWTMTVEQP